MISGENADNTSNKGRVFMDEKALRNTPRRSVFRKEIIFYVLSYGLGGAVINSFSSSFLTRYYTDCVGIQAAMIGTMMLISRFLDGISDIVMGWIVDRTRTKWGKARPWLFVAGILLPISYVAAFNVPAHLSGIGRMVFVYSTYIFLTVITYTIYAIAYYAILPRICTETEERDKVLSMQMFSSLWATLVLMFTVQALAVFGGLRLQQAWTSLTLILAVIAGIMILLSVVFTKEKIPCESTPRFKRNKEDTIRQIKAVVGNRYFLIACVFNMLFLFAHTAATTVYVYYADYVFGNSNLYSLMTGSTFLMFVVIPFVPKLCARFGKRNTMLIGIVVSAIGCVIKIVFAYRPMMFIVGCALQFLGFAPSGVMQWGFASDITEYVEWKKGVRAEGIATSGSSFGIKVGTGLGSAMVGWGLAMGNYNPDLAVQAASAIKAMIVINAVLPLICYVILFAVFFFWNLDKMMPQIQRDLAARYSKAAQI